MVLLPCWVVGDVSVSVSDVDRSSSFFLFSSSLPALGGTEGVRCYYVVLFSV